MSEKHKIIIVDENDKIIGYKDRELINSDDIYRVSGLWIKNSEGGVLLAQRSFKKKHDPGKWGPAVAGTVEKGETYYSNIIKEAKEELGLENINLKELVKLKRKTKWTYFVQWYLIIVDKDINEFKIQEDEVEKIKWFNREELLKEIKNRPDDFLSSIKEHVENF